MERRAYARTVRRRRPAGPGCMIQLARIGVALVVIVVLYGLVARPRLGALVGELALDQIPAPAGQPAAPGDPLAGASGALPAIVAALPPGELVVSEADANAFLAAEIAQLGAVEGVSLRFVAGRAEADVRAYGLSGTLSTGLAAEGGRVVPLSPQLGGTLGLAISGASLATTFADRLNAELERQGRAVDAVRIEAGRVVLVTR